MQNDENLADTPSPVESASPPTDSPASSNSEASSSESSGDQAKETLLDAVLKVTKVTPEPTVEDEAKADAAPASEPEDGVKAEGEEQDAEDAEEEEPSKDVPARTRKKMDKLVRERRALRDQVSQMAPAAEIGQQLHNFQVANNLSTEGIVEALELLVMVNQGNYKEFYSRIAPLIRHTQEVEGVVLPTDLQQMVDQGQMTHEAARQFAVTRFEKANYEIRTRQMQAHNEHAVTVQMKDNVQRSVSAFEQRLAASDPDYKAKAESVRRAAQAMLFERGGQISSVDEALAITKQAYDEVSSQYRRYQAPLRATAPTPGRSNPQTPSVQSQPKSMMDAVKSALLR